jgi:hypothetical protein
LSSVKKATHTDRVGTGEARHGPWGHLLWEGLGFMMTLSLEEREEERGRELDTISEELSSHLLCVTGSSTVLLRYTLSCFVIKWVIGEWI